MNGEGPQVSDGPNDWDEARLEAALERLQEMHIQLRGLRGVLNDVISPLSMSYATPEDLYKRYVNTTKDASKRLESFKLYMNSGDSKEVLERAKSSRAAAQPEQPWTSTDHPDWFDREDKTQADTVTAPPTVAETENVNDTEDDMVVEASPKQIIEEFKGAHGEIITSLEDETGIINVTLPSPANLHFQLDPNSDGQESKEYQVACKGTSRLNMPIFRSIQTHKQSNNLKYMLDMLASYLDVKSRVCARCGRLLDTKAQFPVVRSLRKTKQADETVLKTWEALHEGCI
ncbi:hypothetical protein L228DRAFT_135470 [Xylona heveae TC161]|uniref:Mediator complex subunit 27 n=1 Tax=Xylona heveae (strain CBS 132557 / TC161) TaxID=1328760 RepID=A0A165GYH0_XYLHT|nr:hypothetical protein L228DRAFT_135470 [Xylona heveae TC161]KZF22761.1 hypothetical protein L228DRAFT_135470 [Xylona heveae TC161]